MVNIRLTKIVSAKEKQHVEQINCYHHCLAVMAGNAASVTAQDCGRECVSMLEATVNWVSSTRAIPPDKVLIDTAQSL